MGWLECAGCTLIAFGPPFSMFIFTVARDPLRVILFVAGAFFWLLSLLLSALWWYAVVPLRGNIEFGLFFSIAFQEVFRFLYFLLLKKAEGGLQKVSGVGMHIEGVHPLQNAKHTIAYVCGLGFGVMAGAFSLVNVLADSIGPGTPGFPLEAKLDGYTSGHGTYTFFITSALSAAAFMLLHVFWNVLFFNGCHAKRYLQNGVVVFTHFVVSALSLANREELYSVSLPLTYVIVVAMGVWAYFVAGGSRRNLRNFAVSFSLRRKSVGSNVDRNGQQQPQHPAST